MINEYGAIGEIRISMRNLKKTLQYLLFNTNPVCPDLELNPASHGVKPATKNF
jgi:hypothetical protein